MHIQISLSAAQWHHLLSYLDPSSSAFATVKNAIEINEAPATTPHGKVVLGCDEHEAAALLRVARIYSPSAAPVIDAAIRNAGKAFRFAEGS